MEFNASNIYIFDLIRLLILSQWPLFGKETKEKGMFLAA